jgi:hypothetical protein
VAAAVWFGGGSGGDDDDDGSQEGTAAAASSFNVAVRALCNVAARALQRCSECAATLQ